MGTHEGLMYYTLGQRQGLGIGGVGSGEPWFVADKNVQENTLIVVQGEQHPALYSRSLTASDMNWISGEPPASFQQDQGKSFTCTAKFRYRQKDQQVTLYPLPDQGDLKGMIKVAFSEPQKAVTPGQAVVFYDGEVCLGGATIETVHSL